MEAYKEILKLQNCPVRYLISNTDNNRKIAAHPHWHDAIEILYVTKGVARQQLDENIFEVKKGDIIVIWHDQIHSTFSIQGQECEMAVLQFLMEDIHYSDKSIRFLSEVSTENCLYPNIYNMFETISNEINHKNEGYFHIIKAEIHKFYALAVRNTAVLPIRSYNHYPKKEVILKIFKYIDDNYSNYETTLVSAAKHIHLSVPQFMRIFKTATGMTFKHYLNFYRIKRSLLLLSDNETVTKIAEICGFENINTYIRLFKLHTGITPTQYIKHTLK